MIKEGIDAKQEILSKELEEKNQVIDWLSQKIEELEVFRAQNDENIEKLGSLYEAGLIDEDENVLDNNEKQDYMSQINAYR